VQQPGKKEEFICEAYIPSEYFQPHDIEKEFSSLRDFSARVGGDPLLVQASNGIHP